MVVGGGGTVFYEKEPKGVDLTVKSFGELSCGIPSFDVFGDEGAKPCIEGSPLSYGGLLMGHMAKPLKFPVSPCAKSRDRWIGPLRESLRFPDEVGKAGLPQPDPFAVKPVAVAYENALPVLDETFEGFLGPVLVDQEQGAELIGHHPQPTQGFSRSPPGGLVHMVHARGADLAGNFFIVGENGLRTPLYHLLWMAPRLT